MNTDPSLNQQVPGPQSPPEAAPCEAASSSPSLVEKRDRGWVGPAIVGCLTILTISPFCFRVIVESDLGFHLSVGRLIARGILPDRNTLTWTYPETPWYPNSWLFDLATFVSMQMGGVLGLQLLTFFLVVLLVIALLVGCRQVNPVHGHFLPLALVPLLAPRICQRPHLATWALLAWIVAVGLSARHRGPVGRIFCAGLIAIGSNFHAGTILAAIALGCFCLEAAFQERKHWARESAIGCLGVLGLLANPGGWMNLLYVFRTFETRHVIDIFEAKTMPLLGGHFFFAVLLLVAVLALIAARRFPALFLLALVFGAEGIRTRRVALDFLVIAAPALAAGLQIVRERSGKILELVVLGCCLALGMSELVNRIPFIRCRPEFSSEVLPVNAARFLREHGVQGRLYNSFVDGGFLEWTLPDLPTFQDARIEAFPLEFFGEQRAAERDAASFQEYLRKKDIEIVLTSRHPDETLNGYRLAYHPDWALVYWDFHNELFLRRDVARFRPLVDQLEYHYFHPARKLVDISGKLVKTLPDPELRVFESEVARYALTTADSEYVALARCMLSSWFARADAQAVCDHAASLAGDESVARAVDLARRVRSPGPGEAPRLPASQ